MDETTKRHRKRADRMQAIADHLASNDAEQDRTEALQTARAIALAGLPKRNTGAQSLIRTLRLGKQQWLRVIYSADPEGILPYGQDRFVLAGIQSLALEQRSPVVYFEQVSQLLKMFGLSTDGRSLRRLRERFQRLSGLSIRLRFAETEEGLKTPPSGESIFIIKSFSLPTRKELRNELRAIPIRQHQLALPGLELGEAPSRYGVLLSADFWQHLKEPKNQLILPMDLMQLFVNYPTGWDYAAFLVYRCSRAKTASIVPHDVLMSLFRDSERENDKRVVRRLLRYHEEIMRPYGDRLNAVLEPSGYFPSSGGRPKEQWQLRVGPSKQIIWSGKKEELVPASSEGSAVYSR
jgi:hypothetical protein